MEYLYMGSGSVTTLKKYLLISSYSDLIYITYDLTILLLMIY